MVSGRHPCLPWRQVIPVILNPHLAIVIYDSQEGAKDSVTFDLPHSLPTRQHSSIRDTNFCDPPCYNLAFGVDFRFEPPIPRYDRLFVYAVQFQTGKTLEVGKALDRAMALRTERNSLKQTIATRASRIRGNGVSR